MSKAKMRLKILEVKETQEVGKNKFKKRDVIAMIEGEWPEYYKIEFVQDKTEIPDTLIEGTYATFHINIKGRRSESKKKDEDYSYFTSLQCWKVDAGE